MLLVDRLHNVSHFRPFVQALDDSLRCRFWVLPVVRKIPFVKVDAPDSRGHRYVMTALILYFLTFEELLDVGIDLIENETETRPPMQTHIKMDIYGNEYGIQIDTLAIAKIK